MALRERLEWFARMALLVFLLAGAALVSAITAIRLAIHGREVVVPNVVAKPLAEAQAQLVAQGLGIKVADRAYSDLPPDAVVRQSPPAGARVKKAQRVHVVLSLGPQQIKVPAVEGASLRAARIELLRDGLQVGAISYSYLAGYSEEMVVQQSPSPGEGKATGPRVNLLVSLGERPEAYVMPDLVGLNLAEANHRIAAARLHVGKITFVSTPGAPLGTVVQHVPPRGARVSPATTVDLQIAPGSVF